MKPIVVVQPVPRVGLTKIEAANALGMSVDSLERYVLPDIRVVRRGRLVVVPTEELRQWCRDNSERTIEAA
jgi:hypothetical protein